MRAMRRMKPTMGATITAMRAPPTRAPAAASSSSVTVESVVSAGGGGEGDSEPASLPSAGGGGEGAGDGGGGDGDGVPTTLPIWQEPWTITHRNQISRAGESLTSTYE